MTRPTARAISPEAPMNSPLVAAPATGTGMGAVELPPGPVGAGPMAPPVAPPVAETTTSAGAVQGVVGNGERVTMSGTEETGWQASQATMVSDEDAWSWAGVWAPVRAASTVDGTKC